MDQKWCRPMGLTHLQRQAGRRNPSFDPMGLHPTHHNLLRTVQVVYVDLESGLGARLSTVPEFQQKESRQTDWTMNRT